MGNLLHLPIRWKITGLSFGIVLFSLIIGFIIFIGAMSNMKEKEISQHTLVTARLVSQLKSVKDSFQLDDPSSSLQPIAERIRIGNDVDYTVILDMNRIRLTHPIESKIGTRFNSGDEVPAFSEHVYTSKAKGEQGIFIRSFTPILNEKEEQIGVVVVGELMPSIPSMIAKLSGQVSIILLITLIFGMWGAWLLASHIKRQTFQMEPEELARELVEKTATFNAMNEGVIAINEKGQITVINHSARQLLNVKGDVLGEKISDVVADTRLPEILELGKPLYQREFYIQNRPILSNRIPIQVEDVTVGAVAIFQDKSEVKRLAQELTGVQAFVDALRVQNHEHSNKIHTIAGLLQLNYPEKALDYIHQLTEDPGNQSTMIPKLIQDNSISGLLLGKLNRGKELGIELIIDPDSSFVKYPQGIDLHDLVVILGNLIDNSFFALCEKRDLEYKKVIVFIKEELSFLIIRVQDNGPGIENEWKDQIFTRGFSTKNKEGGGIGLFLVKSIVDRMEGHIQIESVLGEQTTIIIQLPLKVRGKDFHDNKSTTY